MEILKNVSVEKKANVYFEGKVTSRNIFLKNGTKQSLGIMLPGDYEFGTEKKEIMEIISGKLKVLLPDEVEWKLIEDGMTFKVAANSKFNLKILALTDYCCSYVD